MAFKFHKRINLGKGFGLNISKSGVSPSLRTKRGSISKRGVSFKTGIPNLTFRKNFSQKGKGCLLNMTLIIGVSSYIIYNLIFL